MVLTRVPVAVEPWAFAWMGRSVDVCVEEEDNSVECVGIMKLPAAVASDQASAGLARTRHQKRHLVIKRLSLSVSEVSKRLRFSPQVFAIRRTTFTLAIALTNSEHTQPSTSRLRPTA